MLDLAVLNNLLSQSSSGTKKLFYIIIVLIRE